MNKTEMLAKFIAENWNHCPIPQEIEEKRCYGWNEEECKKCIIRNAEKINK